MKNKLQSEKSGPCFFHFNDGLIYNALGSTLIFQTSYPDALLVIKMETETKTETDIWIELY